MKSIVVAVTPVATTWGRRFAEFVAVTVDDVASVIGDHEICAYDDKPSTAGFDVHVVTGAASADVLSENAGAEVDARHAAAARWAR